MIIILHLSYIAKFGNELTEKQAKDLFGDSLDRLIAKNYIAYANNTTKDGNKDNKGNSKSK